MILISEERLIESPYIDWIGHGYTVSDDIAMRPAEYNWHLIFTRLAGVHRTLVVGALEEARLLSYVAGGETLWIRFKIGTFMPYLPAPVTLNREIDLPEGSGDNFWLSSTVWDVPDFENADIFVERLVRTGVVSYDPLVGAALRDELAGVPPRTVRHRFRYSTGLRQNYIRQIKSAERALDLLHQGVSILDIVHQLGYADQPHLTRSLKRFLGYTPRELSLSASL